VVELAQNRVTRPCSQNLFAFPLVQQQLSAELGDVPLPLSPLDTYPSSCGPVAPSGSRVAFGHSSTPVSTLSYVHREVSYTLRQVLTSRNVCAKGPLLVVYGAVLNTVTTRAH